MHCPILACTLHAPKHAYNLQFPRIDPENAHIYAVLHKYVLLEPSYASAENEQ